MKNIFAGGTVQATMSDGKNIWVKYQNFPGGKVHCMKLKDFIPIQDTFEPKVLPGGYFGFMRKPEHAPNKFLCCQQGCPMVVPPEKNWCDTHLTGKRSQHPSNPGFDMGLDEARWIERLG